MTAATQHGVRSPLAECGLHKDAVRRVAQAWGIEVWDKPATPCLSSRLAYGVAVTPERLAMIDQAEVYLRELGFSRFRVRLHENSLAQARSARRSSCQSCATTPIERRSSRRCGGSASVMSPSIWRGFGRGASNNSCQSRNCSDLLRQFQLAQAPPEIALRATS